MTDIFKSLTQYIKNNDKIYIMTHKNPDLDGLGSAIALYTIVKSFHKECYIIDTEDEKNSTVKKMEEILEQNHIEIEKKTEADLQNEDLDRVLLIIVDVHKKELIESPNLLDRINHVIVLDHHIKGSSYITKTILSYINSHMSSVTEFMVYYLKYLNKSVDPVIATIMITGIEIDTNSYKLKTTEKTYEAAAILASFGADSILKQELLKENKEVYLRRSQFVKESYMINQVMAMCTLDEKIYVPKDLAEIAEQLLQFNDVEASFVVGKLKEDVVGISARSLGNVDVETVMEELGGGGHLTDAACQLKNCSIEEAKNKVIKIVNRGE